ncbi:uncharacterized protein LOC129586074 [Paramacrobiotus metropolitanus]|uniref:uncharacterized protein LOC129586074 n=1 Tax=Paramacrobiotus metropolitanus TaxID=2943436 RepID=UPI0024459C67|nr:uncharacterized protein LOC129586074 [Paramacrobiotus metropolitanus]
MAILRSCCWWNNVAYGSYGSAVYSFLLGGIFTIFVIFDIQPFHFFGHSFHGHVVSLGSYVEITGAVALCVSACVLVAGVYRSVQQLLLPWMVCMVLFTLVLITGNIHLVIRKYEKPYRGNGADVLILVMSTIFCLINIYGELCVLSHYQNLCDAKSNRPKDHVLPEKKSISFFKRPVRDFTNSRTWSSYGPSLPAIHRIPIRINVPGAANIFSSKTMLHTTLHLQDSDAESSQTPASRQWRRLKSRSISTSSGSDIAPSVADRELPAEIPAPKSVTPVEKERVKAKTPRREKERKEAAEPKEDKQTLFAISVTLLRRQLALLGSRPQEPGRLASVPV